MGIACQTCQNCQTPIIIRPSRNNPSDPTKQTLLVSFLEQTKRPWAIFGTSRLARLIENSSPPVQCNNCWDYHTRHSCRREGRCLQCGTLGHKPDDCVNTEQCANCLGSHSADLPKCPVRPKRVHGMLRRLTKEQKGLVCKVGL